jgi:tetrahydromethanopterin S-methyltransferase subunit D
MTAAVMLIGKGFDYDSVGIAAAVMATAAGLGQCWVGKAGTEVTKAVNFDHH